MVVRGCCPVFATYVPRPSSSRCLVSEPQAIAPAAGPRPQADPLSPGGGLPPLPPRSSFPHCPVSEPQAIAPAAGPAEPRPQADPLSPGGGLPPPRPLPRAPHPLTALFQSLKPSPQLLGQLSHALKLTRSAQEVVYPLPAPSPRSSSPHRPVSEPQAVAPAAGPAEPRPQADPRAGGGVRARPLLVVQH